MDKSLLNTARDSIVQGFQWATREGPLCDERKLQNSMQMQTTYTVNVSAIHRLAYLTELLFATMLLIDCSFSNFSHP